MKNVTYTLRKEIKERYLHRFGDCMKSKVYELMAQAKREGWTPKKKAIIGGFYLLKKLQKCLMCSTNYPCRSE